LLQHKLHQNHKEAISELHDKASEWFNNNSMSILAVEHAIETGNFEKTIQFIGERIGTMWENGQHAAIMKYGDLLPDESIKQNADFCLYYAWILIIAGQIQRAEPFLVCAETITRGIINNDQSSIETVQYNKKLLGKISVAFAYMNLFVVHPEKIFDYCKIAMENLSEDDPLWFSWGWYSIGIAETVRENFSKSIEAYEKALEYGKKSGNVYLISTIAINLAYLESRMGLYTSSYKKCSDLLTFMKERGYSQFAKLESTFAGLYSCLAGIECMRADFDDALENIKTAYRLSKNDSNSSYKVIVLLVYSLILYGCGDSEGIMRMINEAEEIIKLNKITPAVMAIYIAMKGLILIEQNQLERADNFFKENGLRLDKKISYSDEYGYFAYVNLLITEMKFEGAEILLSKLYTMATAANRIERIIELKVIYAILFKASGNNEKAISNLIESLEYAAEENIIMSYIIYIDKISDLLKEVYKIQATAKTKISKKIIDKLHLVVEKREKLKKTHSEGKLSTREMDTLQLIAGDLTNQEIADKLFISLNTVKSHVGNILMKLEVDTRIQAIAKARELGII
jgi:LuxR family maltose regulon positive regulatory protein